MAIAHGVKRGQGRRLEQEGKSGGASRWKGKEKEMRGGAVSVGRNEVRDCSIETTDVVLPAGHHTTSTGHKRPHEVDILPAERDPKRPKTYAHHSKTKDISRRTATPQKSPTPLSQLLRHKDVLQSESDQLHKREKAIQEIRALETSLKKRRRAQEELEESLRNE
ncbi:hypothetical protein HDV00_004809 [Rhizophlyctis rosea]|nr:hypothetical protein HDV00_004809 [Rhizophlyctis rosea]